MSDQPEIGARPHEPSPDEPTLIEQAQRGDLGAFDRLVLQHQQEVYAVALRMLGDAHEAEEIAQEVFVSAYRSLGTFRYEAKLSTWLVAITMNLCRNRRRWWARRRQHIVASLDAPIASGDDEGSRTLDPADSSPSPAAIAEQREQHAWLLEALQLLEESQRSVIVLRDVQGYSYEEIAQMLHCAVGTLKSRISRARLQLKALLNGRV